MRHDRRRRRRQAGIVALMLASVLFGWPPSQAAGASAIVRAVPSSGTIRIGATVTVVVKIEGARDVGSVPFAIHYDPAILEYVAGSAVEGNFLARDGASTSFIVAPGPASRGGGVVIGLSRLGPVRGARGKGVLCRLAFRARAPGTATLTFVRANVLDPAAQPLEAAFRDTSIRVRPAP